jgi:cytoskeletal protein CcmA (bactofilin family)
MLRKLASRGAQPALEALIGADLELCGDIVFRKGLRVDGVVRGNVMQAPGAETLLVVGEGGRIEGRVHVRDAVLDGTIEGELRAEGRVELLGRARVRGDLCYRELTIHEGAIVEGKLRHLGADAPEEVPALPLLANAQRG